MGSAICRTDRNRFQIYFERINPYVRAIHKERFLAGISLPSHSSLHPPICLFYAMWALASSVSEKYAIFQDYFYQLARKHVQVDELEGRGETMLTISHTQMWCLTAIYEQMTNMVFKGYLSSRKAAALCIVLGLHKLDGVGLTSSHVQAPSNDWIELEQRRRTFWMVFIQDKFLSTASGFPVAIDERDVRTPEDGIFGVQKV